MVTPTNFEIDRSDHFLADHKVGGRGLPAFLKVGMADHDNGRGYPLVKYKEDGGPAVFEIRAGMRP